MAGPAAILREVHRLRCYARDLQNEIDRGPRQHKAQQLKLARQEEALAQAHEAIKQLKIKLHEKELSVKATQQQIARHEKQRNEATSKKEYDALQTEILNERQKIRVLEDEILELMLAIDDKTATLPELEKAVRQAKDELVKYEQTSQTRLASFAEELEQTLKQLAEVEASLPPDVREQYARLVAAKGEDSLAAVRDRSCTACYTAITAQQHNDLLQGNFVLCKSCGRILYPVD
ncbi:MAG: hypothetical protein NZ700_09535 [Gemmataceae bacterium]|nr:hypothetical protein [Gemmataceae bacterium]MDW8266888.1 hypothetical protein [Gemmataceae bacterium]